MHLGHMRYCWRLHGCGRHCRRICRCIGACASGAPLRIQTLAPAVELSYMCWSQSPIQSYILICQLLLAAPSTKV